MPGVKGIKKGCRDRPAPPETATVTHRRPTLRRRGRTLVRSLLIALAAGAAAPVAASAEQPRSFFGRDDRTALAPTRMPWQAIGKFVYDGGGHCSGVLVGERVALTAAHCLFGGGTQPYLDPPTTFQAGYQKGRSMASASVDGFWYPRGYAAERAPTLGAATDGLDYAFVLLDPPIGRELGFLGVHAVAPEDVARAAEGRWRRLDQAGYSADRPEHLTSHRGCLADRFLPNNTLAHRCDIMSGDSGSPLFFRSEGGYRIVAVNASIHVGRDSMNIAVDSRAFLDDLTRFLARYEPALPR